MAYSVMVWLVNPGEYPQQELEETRAADPAASGASTGTNIGYALPRIVYGVYETQEDAEQALFKISNSLQGNEPLRIPTRDNRVWLLPAGRVHYVVCEEAERPKD
ncbi:MAG: hypothetical protein ACFB50_07555 [Rubrobacteraceae bacterium]